MTRNEEKIHDLCSKADADINLCRVAYTVIDNAPKEERAALLEAFVVGYSNTPTDHSVDLPHFMDHDEQERIRQKYGRQVDKRMVALQKMGLSEKEFYDKLWNYLSSTPFLPNFEARVVALYNCVIDKRLPYFAIDRRSALSMEQDEFVSLLASIGEKTFDRMEYILNADFDQKTEQASLIVSMMDSLKSFEERTVFLARLISHFKTERLRDLMSMSEARRRPRFPFGDDEDGDILSGFSLSSLFDEDDEEDDDPGKPVF